MKRTKTYLGTFVNNSEGISSYKLMVKNIRNTVTGGRFVKMFRNNPSNPKKWPCGTLRRDGSSHFDVYLLARSVTDGKTFGWSFPKFFNFTLHR